MINRPQRNQNLQTEWTERGVSMLRNRLPTSLFFASGPDQHFPGKNLLRGSTCSEIALPAARAAISPTTNPLLPFDCTGGQYAPKRPENKSVSLNLYDFPENTFRENTFHSTTRGVSIRRIVMPSCMESRMQTSKFYPFRGVSMLRVIHLLGCSNLNVVHPSIFYYSQEFS